MQKSLFTLFTVAGALVVAPLSAQTPLEDTGPAVWHIDANGNKTTVLSDFQELNNGALGMTNVKQLFIIPDPQTAGRYLGVATVVKPGATDDDFLSFHWIPGSNPVVTTDADTLNGPGGEFQASLSWDGLTFVGDTGAGHPVGNNNAIIASRSALGQQFGNIQPIVGVPGAYIDPQLVRINGQSKIYWADPSGAIFLADIDTNPASATYGSVANAHAAVPSQTGIPGFLNNHSPTPCYDVNGNAIGLAFSIYVSGSGSDTYYVPVADMSNFPGATSRVSTPLHPYPTSVDGTNWNNNPAAIKGTFVYAHSPGYTEVRRIEAVTLSSDRFSSTSGGTATTTLQTPLSIGSDPCIAALNFGFSLLPTALDPNLIAGLQGFGKLTVAPIASVTLGPVMNQESALPLPVGPGLVPSGATVLIEAVVYNARTNEVYLSNVSYIEAF